MATIDLDEIQRRIAAQPAGYAPTSRGNSLPRELVAMLWQLMSSLYGHRWTSSYGDEVDPDRVWAAALHGLDEAAIRQGMRVCVERAGEWPPSAPEFRGMCTGPAVHWEHARVQAEDARWQSRALPDMTRAEEDAAAIDAIRAQIKSMLRRSA